jgi:hypothetical protein
MHAARVENSLRLQRVEKLLSTGKKYTTLDIIKKAKVCAVNSIISELRWNGMDIKCKREGNLWFYWEN